MTADSTMQETETHRNTMVWLVRSVIALNFARFALSFSPRFEGTAESVGLADQLFRLRWFGFRVDFVWLVVSTILIALAAFYFILSWRSEPQAKFNALCCVAWVVAFFIFIARAFLTGIIDFG